MGILVVCFWGVIFPLISEFFTGQKVTVGPPFYERATGPSVRWLIATDGDRPAIGLGTFFHHDFAAQYLDAVAAIYFGRDLTVGCWSA